RRGFSPFGQCRPPEATAGGTNVTRPEGHLPSLFALCSRTRMGRAAPPTMKVKLELGGIGYEKRPKPDHSPTSDRGGRRSDIRCLFTRGERGVAAGGSVRRS